MKRVHILSFSGSYFFAFGLNTERYFVSLRILSEYGKIRTRKSPNINTFHAEEIIHIQSKYGKICDKVFKNGKKNIFFVKKELLKNFK